MTEPTWVHTFDSGEEVLGMKIHDGTLYFATAKGIYVLFEGRLQKLEEVAKKSPPERANHQPRRTNS